MVIEIQQITHGDLTFNRATYESDFYVFLYYGTLGDYTLQKDITKMDAGGMQDYVYYIYAATTEQECIDEKIKLGL